MTALIEKLNGAEHTNVSVVMNPSIHEEFTIAGTYHAVCYDKDGNVKWEDDFHNLITTVGKNALLDHYLAGSAFTQTGPYMGLISSVSWSAVSASDTMSSHSGWLEAGSTNAPTYSGNRGTISWSAASGGSKAASAAVSFSITGTGTIEGAFVVLDASASNTIGNTSGTLFSAGTFATARSVANGDTVNVSYSVSV